MAYKKIEKKEVETAEYSFRQLMRYSTQDKNSKQRKECQSILSDIIKQNKYDLFQRCYKYQIITNGYGGFTHVRLIGYDNKLIEELPIKAVFEKLKILRKQKPLLCSS